MTKSKMYRYLGHNGIITTYIFLDNINYIPMVKLTADKGKILTNGNKKARSIIIEETEVDEWFEIVDEDI